MPPQKKAKIVEAIRRQTSDQVEVTLLNLLPETASSVHQERTKQITENHTRLFFNFDKDAMADLAWVTDCLSHSVPDGSHGKVLAKVLKQFRAQVSRKKSLKARREQCTFKDEVTGRRCGNTFQVESDHLLPKALGGTDELRNRRCLCRNHNQMMAREMLGRNWALAYQKKKEIRIPHKHRAQFRPEVLASESISVLSSQRLNSQR